MTPTQRPLRVGISDLAKQTQRFAKQLERTRTAAPVFDRSRMNDDEIWAAIDAHRLRTADLLESLSDVEWRHRSLCGGWTVEDVAAHLTMQQMGLRAVLLGVVRHPGGMNRMIRQAARRRARPPRRQIIAGIRGTVASRRHNIGVTCQETLIDILVHSQDIAMPLGRRIDVDADAAPVAATRVWSCGATRGRRCSREFRSIVSHRLVD